MSNAVDRAYQIIRDDILGGKLAPGQRLREEELTRLTGVSRTPVREALRRLESDGYAIVEANRGASVPIYSKRDVDEIYGLRALLEGHAARRAATRIKPEKIAELEQLIETMKQEFAKEKKANSIEAQMRRTQLDRAFHEIILASAENNRLSALVSQLAQVALTARTFARRDADDEMRAMENLSEVVRALKTGHPDWAEATIRSHVHNARQIMTAVAEDDGSAQYEG